MPPVVVEALPVDEEAPPANAPPVVVEAPPVDEEAPPANSPPSVDPPSDAGRATEERIRGELRSAHSTKEYEAIQLMRRNQYEAQQGLHDLCVRKVEKYVKDFETLLNAEEQKLARFERVKPSLKGFNKTRQM